MPKKVESWLWLRHPYPFYCEKMCFWLHAETNLTLGTSITCITLILFIRGLSADNGKRVEPVKKRLNHSSRRPDCCFPKFELISNYNSWKSLGCLHLWNLLNLTKLWNFTTLENIQLRFWSNYTVTWIQIQSHLNSRLSDLHFNSHIINRITLA